MNTANQPKTAVTVRLTGEDGNIYNLLGIVTQALKEAGHEDYAEEVALGLKHQNSYDEALRFFMTYVEVE